MGRLIVKSEKSTPTITSATWLVAWLVARFLRGYSLDPWLKCACSEAQALGYLPGCQVSRWASKCRTRMGPQTLRRARRAGRDRLWSPPRVNSRGFEMTSVATGGRAPSSSNAALICRSATALSIGVAGMSPQSRIFAQLWYGLMAARGLKPRNDVCRAEAARIARGPKRAPVSGGECLLR